MFRNRCACDSQQISLPLLGYHYSGNMEIVEFPRPLIFIGGVKHGKK